jgi:hypothetical protein
MGEGGVVETRIPKFIPSTLLGRSYFGKINYGRKLRRITVRVVVVCSHQM